MGIKIIKIILISLLISTSSFFIFSEASSYKDYKLIDTINYKNKDEELNQDKKTNDIDYSKTVWNLKSLFKSDEKWESEVKSFRNDIKELKNYVGKVTKSDVAELCPSLSISAIEKAIAKMVEEGRLEKMGSGKTTYYVVKL